MANDHQIADVAKVIGWIRNYGNLEPPQCQNDPVRGLECSHEVLHSDQCASLILLLVGNTAEDLKDLDQKILLLQSSLKSKKLSKSLLFPPVRILWYYMCEGVSSLSVPPLQHCITNLTGMETFDLVTRLDVAFPLSEIEEVESTACASV